MIESTRQMDKFLERYNPIIKKWGRITFVMEVPAKKISRVMVHRRITIVKEGDEFCGKFFQPNPTEYWGDCLESVLDKMGAVSLVEKSENNCCN